ncbi:SDR family NAD(P)-dependent oxidoreductase [Mangrovicoccus sp. HB161399]|uniref:SDR family NAD(P)-dependent oxidoreductase n=1 Tax=Mangrovicoccus sp. HB161399 TaxID=2720392 RepID=UPI001C130520|nr:SDR family NAD(P)-dependent oxidoreductase [Mangrovicoccus sp. HB161399]
MTPPTGGPGRILITGCSSGIGLDAARTLHARGWTVYATCRSEADCDRLRAEGLDSFRLDYQDEASIASAMAEVEARGGLDALFNNGAFAIPGAVEDLPRGALREIYEANLFGWHDLTARVIPLMRAQGRGRIVNCSSILGFVPAKWRGAYVSTKHALEGLTDVLRLEMADTPVQVILIQPGPIATEIRRNSRAPFERWIDWEASPRAAQYRSSLLKRLYVEPPAPTPGELGPEAVTKALIHALESPRPRAKYRVTWPTRAAWAFRRLLPIRVLDKLCAKG